MEINAAMRETYDSFSQGPVRLRLRPEEMMDLKQCLTGGSGGARKGPARYLFGTGGQHVRNGLDAARFQFLSGLLAEISCGDHEGL